MLCISLQAFTFSYEILKLEQYSKLTALNIISAIGFAIKLCPCYGIQLHPAVLPVRLSLYRSVKRSLALLKYLYIKPDDSMVV